MYIWSKFYFSSFFLKVHFKSPKVLDHNNFVLPLFLFIFSPKSCDWSIRKVLLLTKALNCDLHNITHTKPPITPMKDIPLKNCGKIVKYFISPIVKKNWVYPKSQTKWKIHCSSSQFNKAISCGQIKYLGLESHLCTHTKNYLKFFFFFVENQTIWSFISWILIILSYII